MLLTGIIMLDLNAGSSPGAARSGIPPSRNLPRGRPHREAGCTVTWQIAASARSLLFRFPPLIRSFTRFIAASSFLLRSLSYAAAGGSAASAVAPTPWSVSCCAAAVSGSTAGSVPGGCSCCCGSCSCSCCGCCCCGWVGSASWSSSGCFFFFFFRSASKIQSS